MESDLAGGTPADRYCDEPHGAMLVKTHVSHSYSFALGGNSDQIQLHGWSVTEPEHTWCVGKTSALAIPNIAAPHGYFLELDWQPFVHYPYRPHQSVCITVNDYRLYPYRLAQRETTAFFCPPPKQTDRRVLITFEHMEAARIADHMATKDPRQVAIAFRRVRILPLLENAPMRLRKSSVAQVQADGEQIAIPQTPGQDRMALRDLFTQFEMLAGNCDMGLAMRALGVEQLSFLKFGGATPEVAIRGLETDFAGIGERLSTEIADNPIKEWLVRDGFGLRFHTDQSSERVSESEILERYRRHVQFLRRKFLEDVELGSKIFVFADHIRPRSFEAAMALFLALNRRAKNRMLWVCPNYQEMEPGRVDALVPGLARGSLDIFGGPMEAGHIAVSGWTNVLYNALMVLNPDRPSTEPEAQAVGRPSLAVS